jgi:DNA-binding response OmpR family regulator
MAECRTRCALVLIEDDRNVQLIARLTRPDDYAVAMTTGSEAAARRRNARMLAHLLRDDGVGVELLVGGWAGAERLSRAPRPDALIADVGGQVAACAGLLQYARSCFPDLPLLLVTDRPAELAQTVAELGPGPLLFEKPVDYRDLLAALGGSLRQRRASQVVSIGGTGSERSGRGGA